VRFRDQVVLVTGGGSGIGRATARAFAREGASVVVAGRGAEALAATVELIAAGGGVAAPVVADVTDEGSAAAMVAAVVDRYGRLDIVNTASNLGAHRRQPGLGAYVASKAAVSALTRTAALEYIGEGIRINAISPGPSDTPRSMRPGETEADRAERLKSANPSGRVGALDEIAAAVLYLASPDAAYTVGTDLVVDGGASA
jgi:NAD(P)-dependent dehydrogenase (short-subunit alcohol dehydrogenase family)